INSFLITKEAVQIKWTNVICASHNESWVHVNECRLKAISRNVTILNINATILYAVNDITVDTQLFKRANGYKPWIMKFLLDFCRFFKTSYNPYARLLYHQIKDYTNVNHSCPYVGPIIVKGFHVNPAKIGLPLPTGDYLLAVKWLYDKKLQMTSNMYFSFTENY
ncbi:hypothetical protein KR093_008983, partial [Drosophila rubida]